MQIPFRKQLTLYEAITTMVGAVIGAGVLGIPYAVQTVGFGPGMVVLGVLTLAMILRHVMIGEVALRTRGTHQMVGYYGMYLGTFMKYLMTVVFALGLTGSMLAYIIGVGSVLEAVFGGNPMLYSLGFALVAYLFIYVGLNLIKRSEFVLVIGLFVVIFFIAFFSAQFLDFSNFAHVDLTNVAIPYGVILFALAGSTAIPEIRRELDGNEHLMKKSLVLGTFLPAAVYLLFTFMTLGVTGSETTQVATVGLGNVLGSTMLVLGNLFACIAMGTSMLTIGLGVQDMYRFDYGFKKPLAWLLTVVPPTILYFLSTSTFVEVLNWIGGVFGGIASVAAVVMFWRARKLGKREPEYSLGPQWVAGSVLIILFVFGAIAVMR